MRVTVRPNDVRGCMNYLSLFDELDRLGASQFAGYISASQYLTAYGLIVSYGQKGARVLDWGTGDGHFSYFLLNEGFHVTGFTIEGTCQLAPTMAQNYPERYELVIHADDPATLPFEESTFDIVTSIGVLEHVRETGGSEAISLSEIRRVLRPGGVFVCCHLPNRASWIEAITPRIKSLHHHPYKYSAADIRALTADAGLSLVALGRYGILPRLPFRGVPSNAFMTQVFNMLDTAASKLLSPFCQNYYFAARNDLADGAA
jgi:SAM-dependent methyltransferase